MGSKPYQENKRLAGTLFTSLSSAFSRNGYIDRVNRDNNNNMGFSSFFLSLPQKQGEN